MPRAKCAGLFLFYMASKESQRLRYLLVDAHSVIFAWPELRSMHQRRNVLARDELLKRLARYQDTSGYRVIAVFDGQGARHSESSEHENLQVFYSSTKGSADSIIERLVAKYASAHEMIVVTNDSLEQQTVSSFGGSAISVKTFLEWINDAERLLSRQIRKLERTR
jgi:hypothetical protein